MWILHGKIRVLRIPRCRNEYESRKEYSYTTGTLGNAVKTDLLTYRASGWKDQLISYNGSSISYDAVGNITAYQERTLTWYRGSLLQSLTLNGKKAVYHTTAKDTESSGKT